MSEDAEKFSFLLTAARELGADGVAIIEAGQVVVDERVRLKCAVPRCHGYGRYLNCPPNTLSVAEFREVLARYSSAMIVQVESSHSSLDLDDEGLAGKDLAALEEEMHGDQTRLLGRILGGLEAAALKAEYYYATGFTGGLCSLCPDCVGIAGGEPCRHPFEARPAMEGVGIDVFRTAANAGLPIALSSDQPVRWTGLLLID